MTRYNYSVIYEGDVYKLVEDDGYDMIQAEGLSLDSLLTRCEEMREKELRKVARIDDEIEALLERRDAILDYVSALPTSDESIDVIVIDD